MLKPFLIVIILIFTVGCSTTDNPYRVTSVASTIRTVVHERHNFRTERTPEKVSIGLSGERGIGYSDGGGSHESNIASGHIQFRLLPLLSIGIKPFYADAQGSASDDTNFGLNSFLRFKVVDSPSFRFYLYPSYTYTENAAKESFCVSNSYPIFTDCANPDTYARSSIRIDEFGISTIFEVRLSTDLAIALVPAAYHADIEVSNKLDGYASEDRDFTEQIWNYSGLASLLYRQENGSMFGFSIGLATAKEFTSKRESKLKGIAEISGGFQF